MMKSIGLAVVLVALAGCGGGGGGPTLPSGSTPTPTASNATPTPAGMTPTPTPKASPSATPTPTPSPTPTLTPAPTPTPLPGLPLQLNLNSLPGPFYGEIISTFPNSSPRQMFMLPNGDLLVGTGGGTATNAQSGQIFIVPNAEAAKPGYPKVFATLSDVGCAGTAGTNVHGITFAPSSSGGTIFVGMECSVWKIPYNTGDQAASTLPSLFVKVRTGAVVPNSDGDVHHTTSVLVAGNALYVSVGSSCNACTEVDPTRGAVLKTDTVNGNAFTTVATRFRNALSLALNPVTGSVWAGGAGQDCMVGTTCFAAMDSIYATGGHPFEWMDPITTHTAPADYLWPWCEENKTTVTTPDPTSGTKPSNVDCSKMIVAPVHGPAYGTIIGAAFYAPPAGAQYAFPASFTNGLFYSLHGSWHENTNGIPVAVPQVAFVPMNKDAPVYPMDWTGGGNPISNWQRDGSGNPAPFMNGFQSLGIRYGRPVGIVVGNSGSLFIADDAANQIYRIRPGIGPASLRRAAARALPGPRLPF